MTPTYNPDFFERYKRNGGRGDKWCQFSEIQLLHCIANVIGLKLKLKNSRLVVHSRRGFKADNMFMISDMAEQMLRQHTKIPPPHPLRLESLCIVHPDGKYPLASMIALAIWTSPERRLMVSEIRSKIETALPELSAHDASEKWKVRLLWGIIS